MSAAVDTPRAVAVLVAGDQRLVVPVDHDTACDLDLVSRVLWLRLTVQRLGWTLRLEEVDEEFGDLLEFVGVAACLTRL